MICDHVGTFAFWLRRTPEVVNVLEEWMKDGYINFIAEVFDEIVEHIGDQVRQEIEEAGAAPLQGDWQRSVQKKIAQGIIRVALDTDESEA
jgi:hypothetical protein